MQNGGDAVGPTEIPPLDRVAQHVFDVVPGEVGGAQQTCQGAPLRLLFIPLPLTSCQQRLDRVLVTARRMRAGHVCPHRGERGQAGRPLQLLPHCPGC